MNSHGVRKLLATKAGSVESEAARERREASRRREAERSEELARRYRERVQEWAAGRVQAGPVAPEDAVVERATPYGHRFREGKDGGFLVGQPRPSSSTIVNPFAGELYTGGAKDAPLERKRDASKELGPVPFRSTVTRPRTDRERVEEAVRLAGPRDLQPLPRHVVDTRREDKGQFLVPGTGFTSTVRARTAPPGREAFLNKDTPYMSITESYNLLKRQRDRTKEPKRPKTVHSNVPEPSNRSATSMAFYKTISGGSYATPATLQFLKSRPKVKV
jgi:hypothetical protein